MFLVTVDVSDIPLLVFQANLWGRWSRQSPLNVFQANYKQCLVLLFNIIHLYVKVLHINQLIDYTKQCIW